MKARKVGPEEKARIMEQMEKVIHTLDGVSCQDKLQVLVLLAGVVVQHLLDHHLDPGQDAEESKKELLLAVMMDLKMGMNLGDFEPHKEEKTDFPSPPSFLGISKQHVH